MEEINHENEIYRSNDLGFRVIVGKHVVGNKYLVYSQLTGVLCVWPLDEKFFKDFALVE